MKKNNKSVFELQLADDTVQKYTNFINDNNLANKLDIYETGYRDGRFYLYVTGNTEIIESIKQLSIKKKRYRCHKEELCSKKK